MLKGKKILLGVTGSIAAYKAAILVRLLVKKGAEVKVIMTPLSKAFITPLTLATLSRNPILVEFFDPEDGRWNNHVDLGNWADAFIIAPASANTLAKMANGIADNLLLTTYLSVRCKVYVAPAMDLDMFGHAATQLNLKKLKGFGVKILEPAIGELASGLEGKGRMQEPEEIISILEEELGNKSETLSKKKARSLKVLVTSGPTYEAIDPVRFIGNHSSGKMGFAIANAFAEDGNEVILVSGPTTIEVTHAGVQLIRIESADQMYRECMHYFPSCDCAILSAAVADFTPVSKSAQKIKRANKELTIHFKATRDIAAELGKLKKRRQILVGFALETENEQENAEYKLERKNLDFIVLNSLRDKGAGFNTDTNKVCFIDSDNKSMRFALKSKELVAQDIRNKVYSYF
jgi:phosphopantothenoylcysteine decarboxylase / phosphopantothenate---cysteine ligase